MFKLLGLQPLLTHVAGPGKGTGDGEGRAGRLEQGLGVGGHREGHAHWVT